MAATTTRSLKSLLSVLQKLRPDIAFTASDNFLWNPDTATITYTPSSPDVIPLLLHEFGHAQLNHQQYTRDVTLLNMEQSAWRRAELEADALSITIDPLLVEDHLDTYRDWLHSRSTCPACRLTGIQIGDRIYRCPSCQAEWQVNNAIHQALRRYKK